ncbi:glyoxylase-like metal-dependent hydrolase (beta-lactamase superfamily II) [Rhodobacter sp. JA431]|uniref:MBL fold metallo-hydrolase n=1 Tax=Rhodobacter sp. JA431 TaxID=570013 RepID=UPI000BC5F51B|nr:MBL fold metallo-hydrolase [Rhodobacter sp. JA431]SOC04404.1 glyoxylase-like metal-dependent hydrolase (beta-lactamase superfamily II) [Rhodobacter sp. JA431]
MALERLAQGIRRIVAPNPSPLTFRGTNTYILGTGRVAVLDPGPAISEHLEAILSGLEAEESVAAILVTHAHLDHSEGARPLAQKTGAPIFAFGGPKAGRSEVMQQLAAGGLAGGGEGVDATFTPDHLLGHGTRLSIADWAVTALFTPGHFCNHLSFRMGRAIFTGDVVMGWSSTLISPPDGDLGDYYESLDVLAAENAEMFYPGHGDPIAAPATRLAELRAHRQGRTEQILAALAQGPASAFDLTAMIYTETPAPLQAAAARNVFAHLVELEKSGQVIAAPALGAEAIFTLRKEG